MVEREIKNLFGKLSGVNANMQVKFFDATVTDIDEDNGTCLVESADGGQSFNDLKVRYMSELADGDENIPEVGSSVTILFTQITEPIIIGTSWLERKTITIGDSVIDVQRDSITFNDGSFGGLVKVIELTKRIKKLEDTINALSAKFIAWTPVSGDGGLALRTILTVTPPIWNNPNITPIQRSDIENTKITHGK